MKMIFDNKKIIGLSRIGSRAAFGMTLFEIEKKYEDLCVLAADTSTSAGLDRFRKQIPNKYFEMGISEQNMMGVAAGLSSEGLKVITTTFSPFQTLRCAEQIKVNLGYMCHKVIMTGLASGLVLGNLGYTHCSIEDISIIKSIPNIDIISPADCLETAKATIASLDHGKSVYIRLTGDGGSKKVYEADYNYEIGKSILLKEYGLDACIICNGTMVRKSLDAAELLLKKNIKASVYNFHTIRPLDNLAINQIAKRFKYIFSVEEHSIIGGLGSEIATAISNIKNSPRLKIIGLPHKYEKSGNYSDLLNFYGLTDEKIADQIENEIKDA